jgi:hypothetical protein
MPLLGSETNRIRSIVKDSPCYLLRHDIFISTDNNKPKISGSTYLPTYRPNTSQAFSDNLCKFIMSTHKAIATVAIRAPLEIIEVPTIQPIDREVRFRVEWTASTPLHLHQNDGGLLVEHPQILGGNSAGTVVEVGPAARNLKVGDKVS